MLYWQNEDGEWVPMVKRTAFSIITTNTTNEQPPATHHVNALPAILRRHALWFAAWQRRQERRP